MFADAQYSPENGAPTFADEQHSTGIGASTFIDAHYSTADGAPTFTDTQHSQINGASMFVDAPFRFEVQYLAKKLRIVVRHDHPLLHRTESCIHAG